MTSLAERVDLVIGVDTHKHTHTAAVVDATTGGTLSELTVSTDPGGYGELLTWVGAIRGGSRVWALEGGGGYGAGLARFLGSAGEQVVELDRPKRAARRHGAKSDSLDAVRAAREALAREHLARIKDDGPRAELAVLMAARRSGVEAATLAQRQLLALVTAAPEELRAVLRGANTTVTVQTAARLRTRSAWDRQTVTTANVLRTLARRVLTLQGEARDHETAIGEIVRSWRPDLLTQPGIGALTAAQVLIAWSHPGRIRSEAAFAMLAGTAPIPASSGMTIRHRLNRSGDRQLNRALHVIALSRARYDQRTRDYIDRRRAQGKTDREIRRCLKRYIARDLFRQLEHGPLPA
ncbi:transposase [Cellulomonas hominis]|uniref:Transposase n=1 Tax=Cellulomonas hominis TaxID=156981 RepID=A0A7W8SHG2_9CELL|nr:transposase [Cellulomonas hominis]MBB5475192.1 transposase [Cellulomonas hominis]NKY12589.1 IS110 family transposase [Cellulomonas hominis]